VAGRETQGDDVRVGAIPEPWRAMGSLDFAKFHSRKPKVAVSPGIGFDKTATASYASRLSENEHRTRQHSAESVKR